MAVDAATTDAVADMDELSAYVPISHPPRRRSATMALAAGAAIVIALGAVCAWLGYRAVQFHIIEQRSSQFLATARQAAINLTTIHANNAEQDVQRILSTATGSFHDDFLKRAPQFVDAVKQAQSNSEGSIAEAGIESSDANQAQVLVAVTVKTAAAGTPEQPPQGWRMRISLQTVGPDVKVSNVEFVP